MKFAFRILAVLTLTLLAGCAHDEPQPQPQNNVSTIPWNRPQTWEGTGALGGMVPNSQ